MTTRVKIVRFVAQTIEILLDWWLIYLGMVIVCKVFDWNPMQETLVWMAMTVLTFLHVLDLKSKFEG